MSLLTTRDIAPYLFAGLAKAFLPWLAGAVLTAVAIYALLTHQPEGH